jgi:hypothetical protein
VLNRAISAVTKEARVHAKLRLRLSQLVLWVTVIPAIVGGIALLSANILSIRDNLHKLITGRPTETTEIPLRDTQGYIAKPPDDCGTFTIEVIVKKSGNGASACRRDQ